MKPEAVTRLFVVAGWRRLHDSRPEQRGVSNRVDLPRLI